MTRGRRIVAARYLRTLATIETLLAIGNESEAHRLLAGIDHLEARELANELDAENDEQQTTAIVQLRLLERTGFHPESLRA